MKCPVCGHESDGKFCENCGSPLTQNNTQENATNSVDSFGQNPTPEQPNYDYNTENQSYDQANQNNNQQYDQGYNNGSQQFTNVPNGQKNNSSKTAIIITSIVGGIIVLLIVIISVVACSIIPRFVETIDKHSDKAIDDASSYISKDFDKESTAPAFDSDSATSDIDEDDYLTDTKSHVTYCESYDYEGWKIMGVDDHYFYNNLSHSYKEVTEITINIPEQIDGVDVVEISSFGVYLSDVKVKVVIPKTVKVVDSFAFSFNDNIYELEIADGVKVLESDAFTSMPNLKSVTVPDSVKEMDNCGLGMDVDDNYDSVPLKGFKMYCKKGSAAEAYAKENNLSYEIIK
uniref:leucine-rich repeat protein n=1 Tax=Ruminococcus bromii TaxID=40518 RepID=UPI004026B4DB